MKIYTIVRNLDRSRSISVTICKIPTYIYEIELLTFKIFLNNLFKCVKYVLHLILRSKILVRSLINAQLTALDISICRLKRRKKLFANRFHLTFDIYVVLLYHFGCLKKDNCCKHDAKRSSDTLCLGCPSGQISRSSQIWLKIFLKLDI